MRTYFPGESEELLSEGWTLALTPADAYETPSDIPASLESLHVSVPGTVAQALEAAEKFDRLAPTPLNDRDAWYRLTMISDVRERATLRFDGLSTIAEIFFNGELIAASQSMFERLEVPVELTGADELAICFRALAPRLEKTGPRARWRPQMMNTQGLRLIRTTALGYMPGWCPEIHAAGPWRPISLIRQNGILCTLQSSLDGAGTGTVSIALQGSRPIKSAKLGCAGYSADLSLDEGGTLSGELRITDVEQWWPHTHGRPTLHDVVLELDGTQHRLARTGFRRVEIDHGEDGKGFGLRVNGQPVFCRGAVWTTADIVRLPGTRPDYEPWLRKAAEAGMNMIRIGGTMTYETPEFFALCDELGIMVWQDAMLANFDYPARDESLRQHIVTEISQFLEATALSPSLAIFCGGSEMYQQGAMLGLPEQIWKGTLTEEVLPELLADKRPDAAYVANSPSGGALPFFPNTGVGHYYGVGAYCRPLEDARRAGLRFAAECLAFANVPEQKTLDRYLPGVAVHDPRWKAHAPRDRGASWDFEDVRDHYLKLLYDVEPDVLRREDGGLYLDMSRAATAEVMEATFAEWRRSGSSCQGALVWTLQDLLPGAGWGIIDATGRPKSVWHALKRAFRPVQVNLLDEGTNGLDIQLINETGDTFEGMLELTCLRDGAQPVVHAKRSITLSSRQSQTIAATDLFGAFFDTTYTYRFGPPSHDVTVARLRDVATGQVIADAFHFPLGRKKALQAANLQVAISRNNDIWSLEIGTDRLAQSVHVAAEGYRASENWFHLAPGESRKIGLVPETAGSQTPPSGEVVSLGSRRRFSF
ncbi:glycoside hydrolase family 2 protein [Agrobacterium pusense]|uniref:glycoside hydrolase family 2 protein n=1 Tax=Agrobacterium pusense TaxID=648995 RepID=UPI0010BEB3EE|nr:glycoside hydrolase family 2 protein [Agrobacterium pusense]MDH0115379.1 glycoside hydrolase family 2 protein [Agrobacterium pusense]QCL85076.1 glycoside hydrolase family 2 protein [Agrobacterium pusense]